MKSRLDSIGVDLSLNKPTQQLPNITNNNNQSDIFFQQQLTDSSSKNPSSRIYKHQSDIFFKQLQDYQDKEHSKKLYPGFSFDVLYDGKQHDQERKMGSYEYMVYQKHLEDQEMQRRQKHSAYLQEIHEKSEQAKQESLIKESDPHFLEQQRYYTQLKQRMSPNDGKYPIRFYKDKLQI